MRPAILRVITGADTGSQAVVEGRLPIGRASGGLRLSDEQASRFHAVIDFDGEHVTVADAGSARGTRVDGEPVDTPVTLRPGHRLQIGNSILMLLVPERYERSAGFDLTLIGPEGERVPIPSGEEVVIGRHGDVVIAHRAVSGRHAVVRRDGEVVTVEDLGSRNGVSIRGRRLQGPHEVHPGDEFDLRGSGWRLVAGTASVDVPQWADIAVTREGAARTFHVRITAGADSTVADVADALAAWFGEGAPDDAPWTLYRPADGVLLHRDDAWRAVPVERGDSWTLATVDGFPDALSTRSAGRSDPTVRVTARIGQEPEPAKFTTPRAPEPASLRGRGIAWQLGGGALGLVGGIALGATTGNWLFALFGGIAGVGTMMFGLLAEQSRRKSRISEFQRAMSDLERSVEDELTAERERARAASPPSDDWPALIESRSGTLWQRMPEDADFLALTLGVGARNAALAVERAPGADTGELAEATRQAAVPRLLEDVPITTPTGGVLGIAGDARATARLARHLVLEAALVHAPSALPITVIASDPGWQWLRWLPHIEGQEGVRLSRSPEAATRLIRALTDRREGERGLVLISWEAASLASGLLQGWRQEDGLLVVLAADQRSLPVEARYHVVVKEDSANVSGSYAGAPVGDIRPVAVSEGEAITHALGIGRLVDPRRRRPTRAAASLLDLSGIRRHGSIDPAGSWRAVDGSGLGAIIGLDDAGESITVDLQRDGPHAVVAGTTGSGKSEVLASLLASLVGRYGPEDLALFLIDFKGGATFNRFAGLPHVAGVVTDLEGDGSLARRAFTALEAELRRRKGLFGASGHSDLGDYRAAGSPGGRLPSMLVVIDEFALLVQQQPEVKSRLDAVASQGRSLGVHLVLATQSPGGVITPAIRANTNLWLCLRVVSEAESRELLGRDDAARLPTDRPGRVILRRGAESSVTAFQSARITLPHGAAGERQVQVEPFADDLPASVPQADSRTDALPTTTELDALLRAVRTVSSAERREAVRPLWLPPLPGLLRADDLPEIAPSGGLPVVVGLSDAVEAQRQEPYVVDLAEANLLVTGGPGSGRSSTLLRVAVDLAERLPPARVHLYGLAVDASLNAIQDLPHTGAVVQLDDLERLTRLLDRVTRELEARRGTGQDAAALPAIVLLIDDYPTIRESLADIAQGRLLDQLHRLASGGRTAGVHVVLAATQPTDLRLGVLNGFGQRIMLRTTDRSDYLAIEWRPSPEDLPPALPGRAMVAGPLEVQVVYPDVTRARQLAGAWPAVSAPSTITRMPVHVPLTSLAVSNSPKVDAIGIGGSELEPVLLDTSGGAHLVVLGESGTGRSTALATVASAYLQRDEAQVGIVAVRPGPLDALASGPRIVGFARDRSALGLLLDRVESLRGPCLLVIDDADGVVAEHGDRLERMLRMARDTGLRVVVAGRASDWARAFDPWVRYLTSLRSALLLSNFTELAPMFDVRLPMVTTPPSPGRGFLVTGSTVTHVQVASPDQHLSGQSAAAAIR